MYELESISIKDLLDVALNGKICIPNIQRPYVWKPQQLAHLIDSLMRGYPCGNILLWNVKAQRQHIFVTRPFVLDIHPDNPTAEKTISEENGCDYLVLDGQQRLQSLVIAFARNSEGYFSTPKLWNSDRGKTGGNNSEILQKWLCFDLHGWKREIVETNPSYYYLDYPDYSDAEQGQSEQNKTPMLCWATREEIERGNGLIIKLSDVLRMRANSDAEQWLKDKIQLAMSLKISLLKVTTDLKAESRGLLEDETIVQIFTRLNTAGTPLTTEQVQAARIKSVWPDFPTYTEKLKKELAEKFHYNLKTDDLVKGFNVMLLVKEERHDLNVSKLYAGIPVCEWSNNWKIFRNTLIEIFSRFEKKDYKYKKEYQALYIIWFSVAAVVKLCPDMKDSDWDEYLIRFGLITTWSRIWANRSGQYVRSYIRSLIKVKESPSSLQNWIIKELNGISKAATDSITDLAVNHRGSVRLYYTYLWVWMRLKEKRSNLLTRFGNVNHGYEVDHILPISWFDDYPNHKYAFNQIGNCWLLLSTANRSKSADSLSDYIKESGNLGDVEKALGIEQKYAEMHRDDIPKLVAEAASYIEKRSADVKNELKEFASTFTALCYPQYRKRGQSGITERNLNTSGIFKGREFFQTMTNMGVEEKRLMLAAIRESMRILNVSEHDFHEGQGAPRLEKVINTLDDERLGSNLSIWRKYVIFLIDNNRRNAMDDGDRGKIGEVRGTSDFETFITKLASKWENPRGPKISFGTECAEFIKGHWSYRAHLGNDVKFYRKVINILKIDICLLSSDKILAISEIDNAIAELKRVDNPEWNAYLEKDSMVPSAIRGIFVRLILPELKKRLQPEYFPFEAGLDEKENLEEDGPLDFYENEMIRELE